ncbi:MAG: Hsp20/alpha crystallin family protein [Bacteroidetes bacterium]|nr:Hsp20/alpha crystallin family protein [Bacteroidota bacterium]
MTLVKFNDWNNQAVAKNFFSFSDLVDNFFGNEGYCDDYKAIPEANIFEDENKYQIELAVPGLEKTDIKVEIDKNILKIHHKSSEKKENENHAYSRREFRYNEFTRTFIIPESVDDSKVKAKYQNGILILELAKKQKSKVEQIHEIRIS